MGARPEDYERSAPYHSYIHVDDFEGPKQLAEYLHKLDQDDNLYQQYFQWKVSVEMTLECLKCSAFYITLGIYITWLLYVSDCF